MKKNKVEVGITVCSMQLKSIIDDAVKQVYLQNKDEFDKKVVAGVATKDSYSIILQHEMDVEELGLTYYALKSNTLYYLLDVMNVNYMAKVTHIPMTIVMDHIKCIFKKLMPTYLFSDDRLIVLKDKELARQYCKDVYKIVKEQIYKSILKPVKTEDEQ